MTASPLPASAVPAVAATPLPSSDATGKLALFRPPFDGDFSVLLGDLFDHDLPFEFEDRNGRFVTFWGESIFGSVDGHNGYDWRMPEGTPLVAVAAGRVSFAGLDRTVPNCPVPGRSGDAALKVHIDHQVLLGGHPSLIRSQYLHLSRIDVKVGDPVVEGQAIGLSGNTGCTDFPHLHFSVFRSVGTGYVVFDPFGWEGSFPDPWAAHPAGVESVWMWKTPPPLYVEDRGEPNPRGTRAKVAITAVRWLAYGDGSDPNKQSIELTLDGRFAPSGSVDMTGYTLSNAKGDRYAFPRGFTLRAGSPARVYAGSGQDTTTALFWGRSARAWDHVGDCAQLTDATGSRYQFGVGTGCK